MTLITDKPEGLKSSNDLDDIDLDDDTVSPAYLKFGISNCAIEDPPAVGDTRTYLVRVRCTGEHGPIERKDGEMRFERSLSIQLCWEQGKPQPPDPEEPQPGLFDDGDEPQTVGEVMDGMTDDE
jgi:hypothetical protein